MNSERHHGSADGSAQLSLKGQLLSACQAAALLRHRVEWTTQLAKHLDYLPQEMWDFLQNPGSDASLLEALACCAGSSGSRGSSTRPAATLWQLFQLTPAWFRNHVRHMFWQAWNQYPGSSVGHFLNTAGSCQPFGRGRSQALQKSAAGSSEGPPGPPKQADDGSPETFAPN